MALVLDTGPLLSLLDADDPDHERCASMLAGFDETLVVVAPTLVEIDYWVRKRLQPEVWSIFIEDLARGAYRLESPRPTDLERIAELELQYRDLGLGFVDAAVIATCERLNETKVATLDERHFRIVRPAHCDHLEILPH